MSLTQTLMNGGMVGCSINPARYNHDNGALRIATESVEELHDIFMTTFYATEQAELGAVHEGVALEESSYAAVYEGAVRDAFTKVKEFFKKLWDKVKAWFHNVKRFFDSLIMSGKDFVKKYKNDINKAHNIKDFEFKMFDYNDALINSADKNVDIDGVSTAMFNDLMSCVKSGDVYAKYDDVKKEFEHDAVVKSYGTGFFHKNVNDLEEFNDLCYSVFRSKKGVTGITKDDKEDVDITDISTYASILENAGNIKSVVDSMAKKTDKTYTNAIKQVENLEKEERSKKYDGPDAGKNGQAEQDFNANKSNISKVLNGVSSALSTMQSMTNTYMNEWKVVVKERDSVYKQLIIAGLANHRKNSKKK